MFVQEKAVEALEIFDELVESDISVIVPHLKTILEFCLNVSHFAATTTLLVLSCGATSYYVKIIINLRGHICVYCYEFVTKE